MSQGAIAIVPGMTHGSALSTTLESPATIGVNRLLVAADPGLASHLSCFGTLDVTASAPRLLAEVEASGLTGRGGAGFAAWRKLAATRQGRHPVVIANGAEGEPLSRKDSTLLTRAPHLVLDGLLVAVAATGAGQAHVYSRGAGLEAVHRAAKERPDTGLVRFTEAPDAFVAGEATAVVNGIESGTARPRDRVTHLSSSGLGGRRTLLHNVETLAQLGLIARYGAAWFRQEGTVDDPGTRLLTLAGDVPEPQVREVAGGVRLSDVLAAAGCDLGGIAGVLVGGYHGVWLGPESLDAVLSAGAGVHPGAGVLCVLDRHRCGIQATAEILCYLAEQSARQCGPCRFGLPALAQVWSALAFSGASAVAVERAHRLAEVVSGRGACTHPDGTARLARSALTVFAADLRAHANGHCLRAAD